MPPGRYRTGPGRQKEHGGLIGDNLLALGVITRELLEAVLSEAPPMPKSIEDTGIDASELFKLMLKSIYTGSLEIPSKISERIRLPYAIVNKLLIEAGERNLLESLGSTGSTGLSEHRYSLTERGKRWAAEALNQNQYVGPAPVCVAPRLGFAWSYSGVAPSANIASTALGMVGDTVPNQLR